MSFHLRLDGLRSFALERARQLFPSLLLAATIAQIAANAIFVICCSHLLAFGTFIRVRSLQITSQLSKVRENSTYRQTNIAANRRFARLAEFQRP
jgi:hypothetical protein